MWLLLACVSSADDTSVRAAPPDSGSDSGGSGGESGETGETAASFVLTAPTTVPLPFVTVGEGAPAATFHVSGGAASVGELTVSATGPFTVELATAPLAAGEEREATVRFTGSTASPTIERGALHLACDGQAVDIDLAAVVGDDTLPRLTWDDDAWGRCATAPFATAPFPYGSAPYDDPSVRICLPTGVTDRALGVVTHFHGHNATIDEVDDYQRLHAQVALSGRDTIFVLPQGPVEAADGDFGRLDEPDGLANLLRDVVSALYRDGEVRRPWVESLAVTSHSGGYNVTANVIEAGGVPVDAVHLYDSLYGRSSTFEAFAVAGGLFRSSYTDGGGTDANNRALAAALHADGLDVGDDFADDTLRASPVTVGYVDMAHADCLTDERSYARWLAASGLPRSPAAPPELLATTPTDAGAMVRWRADGGFPAVVEGSDDGASWTDLGTTDDDHLAVPAHPYLRVRAALDGYDRSAPSDTYGATGATWLVVDGFDRVFGGSWEAPTHGFAAAVGAALGEPFAVASNEAVAEGKVSLGDYPHVLWLLGDESTADRTFEAREQDAVETYLEDGGTLVVSGSEVGYASGSWLGSALHATYVSDDAGTDTVEGWTMGVTYPEDYPDVLSGDEVLWRYATGGAAAVGWSRRVVVIGFAVETLGAADLRAALADLRAWLGG